MRVNLIKSIWITAVIAVVFLLVAASPSIAAPCAEMTAENCDSSPYHHKKASIPMCCLTADCLLSHCSLSNAADNKVLLPNRFIPNKNFCIAVPKTSVCNQTSPNLKKPLQRERPQEIPPNIYTDTEYHCRDCLSSEEPHQV